MRQDLELYYKSLSDGYSMAFEDLQHSSIALSLIKGIALDFEFDVLKYLTEQISKGKTDEEKEKIKSKCNHKLQDKIERIEIMRKAIIVLERVVGRENGIKGFISLKNKQNGLMLDRIKELEEKIENMENFIASQDE